MLFVFQLSLQVLTTVSFTSADNDYLLKYIRVGKKRVEQGCTVAGGGDHSWNIQIHSWSRAKSIVPSTKKDQKSDEHQNADITCMASVLPSPRAPLTHRNLNQWVQKNTPSWITILHAALETHCNYLLIMSWKRCSWYLPHSQCDISYENYYTKVTVADAKCSRHLPLTTKDSNLDEKFTQDLVRPY